MGTRKRIHIKSKFRTTTKVKVRRAAGRIVRRVFRRAARLLR